MEHLQSITTSTFYRVKIKEKVRQTTYLRHLSDLWFTERAGIRTPDNLIKSQVLRTLVFRVFTRFSNK